MALASVPTTRILKEWSMTHDPKPSLAYDLSRRDFLTVVLATAPAAAVAGRIADWPEAQRDRPVFEHEELFVDDSGYLITGGRDPSSICPELPTRREYYAGDIESLSDAERVRWVFDERGYELLDTDPDDPAELESWVDALDAWLDEQLDPEEVSGLGFLELTADENPYAIAVELYDKIGINEAHELGLAYIDGEHPGSSFFGVKVVKDIETVNARLRAHGYNLVIN